MNTTAASPEAPVLAFAVGDVVRVRPFEQVLRIATPLRQVDGFVPGLLTHGVENDEGALVGDFPPDSITPVVRAIHLSPEDVIEANQRKAELSRAGFQWADEADRSKGGAWIDETAYRAFFHIDGMLQRAGVGLFPREYDDRDHAGEDAAFFTRRYARRVEVLPGKTKAWRLAYAD